MDVLSLTSQELNTGIHALCMQDPPIYDAFGEKPIAYLGWFWRDVNFDAPTHWFGVVPVGADANDVPIVGFMEKNKWGYSTVEAGPEAWAHIKQLLCAAVAAPSPDTLAAVNDAIQALGRKETL